MHTYRLDHPARDRYLGAVHMLDLPLLFGTYASSDPGRRLISPGHEADRVSQEMIAAWGGFVRDGDPGWPAVEQRAAEPQQARVFGRPGRLTLAFRALSESNSVL